MRRVALALLLVVATVPATGAVGPCAQASAAAEHRAGLVVAFPDGAVRSYCVGFAEDHISGLELLRRSGLALTYQVYGGDQVTVCSIDGQGCPYPRTPCFCHCTTGTCTFWGYYRIDGGAASWTFSDIGAASREVRPGDVDGWRWGAHGPTGSDPPPAASLANVCANGVHVEQAATRTAVTAPHARGGTLVSLTLVGVLVAGLGVSVARRRRRA